VGSNVERIESRTACVARRLETNGDKKGKRFRTDAGGGKDACLAARLVRTVDGLVVGLANLVGRRKTIDDEEEVGGVEGGAEVGRAFVPQKAFRERTRKD